MTDDEIQGLLRSLRDQPVPADSLARVRMRVSERTSRRNWRVWWVPAMAVVWIVLTVLLWPRRVIVSIVLPVPPVVEVIAQVPAPLPAAVQPAVIASSQPSKLRKRPRPAALVGSIRIETPDPDVVLIFVNDGGED